MDGARLTKLAIDLKAQAEPHRGIEPTAANEIDSHEK